MKIADIHIIHSSPNNHLYISNKYYVLFHLFILNNISVSWSSDVLSFVYYIPVHALTIGVLYFKV